MSGCINVLVLRRFNIPTPGYTPTIIKATLQAFVTVLEQIAPMLDDVSQLVDVANDGSMVALLNQTIIAAKSQPQEKEPQEEQKEEEDDDSLDPVPFHPHPLPAHPLPCYVVCASGTLKMIGVTRHSHINGYLASALTSQLMFEQKQEFFDIVTGISITCEVKRSAVKNVMRVGSAMLYIYQELYTAATLPRPIPSLLDVLKQLIECVDEEQVQQLLLCFQYHLERGIKYINNAHIVFHQEVSRGHYIVPYVAPMEDDADVLAPRPQEYSTLVGYAQALLAVVNKIVTSSA
jgi:hypothetical protein